MRLMRWRAVAAKTAVLVATAAVLVWPHGAQALARDRTGAMLADDEWWTTDTGPLGPADRDLLVRVRTAGLWEGPAGEMAQERAASDTVKEVGRQLRDDHAALDVQVRMVAAQLGVDLPANPTAQQQGWLEELADRSGAEFDQVFADRLRAAHGAVFAVVALVRAGTRNDTIRAFAQTANTVVLKHMTLLEGIGLVHFDHLPTPPAPPVVRSSAGQNNPSLVWLVLGIAAVVGVVTAARVVRPR
jgi:predicted outer membrane protein